MCKRLLLTLLLINQGNLLPHGVWEAASLSDCTVRRTGLCLSFKGDVGRVIPRTVPSNHQPSRPLSSIGPACFLSR